MTIIHPGIQPAQAPRKARRSSPNALFARGVGAITLGLVLIGGAPPTAAAETAVFVPGARIGIVPPEGFTPSRNIQGFEDASRKAAILLFELPREAFAEIQKSSNDPLKAQGVTVEKREIFPLNGEKALLLTGHQQANDAKFKKWILIAPAAELTAIVSVQVAEEAADAAFESTIRAALATMATRPDVPMQEQVARLPFRIGDAAGFRPVRVAPPSTEVLTYGDQDTFDNNAQPLLILTAAPGGPESASARATFAANLFTGFTGLKDMRVTGTDMIRLQGMQIHQIMADAKNEKSGDDVKVVQWIRFGGGAFLRIVGIARADAWTDAFPRMRTARDSIGSGG